MRPTSAELITRIAEALDEQVLPAIRDDKWAASVVRSATTLLMHLAVRVEREVPVLLADNEDVRAVLSELAETHPELRSVVLPVLDAPGSAALHDAVALEARNREYQIVVEQLLRNPSGEADVTIRQSLRSYLKRRMDRERDLYFPAFTGPPF